MAIPAVALLAARLAARRAALSAARRGGTKLQKASKVLGGTETDARKRISWAEILFVALFIALPNDLLDAINLTGIGKIITIFIEPLTLFLIGLWFWFRVKEKPGRKAIKNVLTFVGEIIPIIGLAPLWTILVINVKTGWLDPILNIPAKIFKL